MSTDTPLHIHEMNADQLVDYAKACNASGNMRTERMVAGQAASLLQKGKLTKEQMQTLMDEGIRDWRFNGALWHEAVFADRLGPWAMRLMASDFIARGEIRSLTWLIENASHQTIVLEDYQVRAMAMACFEGGELSQSKVDAVQNIAFYSGDVTHLVSAIKVWAEMGVGRYSRGGWKGWLQMFCQLSDPGASGWGGNRNDNRAHALSCRKALKTEMFGQWRLWELVRIIDAIGLSEAVRLSGTTSFAKYAAQRRKAHTALETRIEKAEADLAKFREDSQAARRIWNQETDWGYYESEASAKAKRARKKANDLEKKADTTENKLERDRAKLRDSTNLLQLFDWVEEETAEEFVEEAA